MSKILGIIAEYNPFHNGHLYHLNTSVKKSGADAVVCVMSGDFVQRGEPALLDKWIRAKTAVDHGVDLVIELPFLYACNNAEWFARGAVRILNGLGCIDVLSFGSECGDLTLLKRVAKVITGDTDFDEETKAKMQTGLSYPRARQEALKAVAGTKLANVVTSPNDTLAVEYLRQLLLMKSTIEPMAIQRVKEEEINPAEVLRAKDEASAMHWDSATRIRGLLSEGALDEAFSYMPEIAAASMREYVSSGGRFAFFPDIFPLLTYAVRTGAPQALSEVLSATEGLENRLLASVHEAKDMFELLRRAKTKRYTETRIKRLMIHTLLRLTKAAAKDADRAAPYARVLAFSERGAVLLRGLRAQEKSITLLSNPNRVKTLTEEQRLLLSFDSLAADIYRLIVNGHFAGNADLKKHPRLFNTYSLK